jgi:ABC-type glycerol-3-phosphate transport system substrate-binding protein
LTWDNVTRALRLAHFALILLLVGCSSLAPFLDTPTPAPIVEATSTPQATPTSTATVTTNQPRILRIWLPPRFDPNAGTPSAELLKQRLLDFENEYGVAIEVRIKSEENIQNTISVTSNAAPAAMPDLIALSYSDMQAVASAGFLHPLDGLTSLLQDPDWYAFARDLGHFKNTEFGIPFAGDVLLTIYRSAVFEAPPATWSAIFDSGILMVFPVSDPKAFFPLSLYLSEGGQLTDDQGAVTLNEQTLIRLLSFYQQAIKTESVSPLIRDYQTDAQALQYYHDGNADLAVVWASSDIQSPSGGYLPLLGMDNTPYSLGDGWVWALAGSNTENQPLAVELAAYLVDSGFMSEWTHASGYLPTRPQALAGWDGDEFKKSVNEILQSAHPIPSRDVVSVLGPRLQEALIRIFKGDQPEVVAGNVIENLK